MDTEPPPRLVCLCNVTRAPTFPSVFSTIPFPKEHIWVIASQKSRAVFRILDTDLSELSKAFGRKGVEVLSVGFCVQESGQRQQGNLLVPGILDHRLLKQRDRPRHGPFGGDALPLEDVP